ncbi:SnoaL-like domain-containing protein [Bordetella tumbae]|uniref:hypothetical protein n=1 Tax=Bordetella tumbae TaxID=1649139 RepID=UPI0039F03A66
MVTQSTIDQYFAALQSRNGVLAASLFEEHGAIDDFRGRCHAGRQSIRVFIAQVPTMTVEFLSEFIVRPNRVTVYGNIHYPGQAPVLVRWIFSGTDGLIEHLCNSRIEQVPEAFHLHAAKEART